MNTLAVLPNGDLVSGSFDHTIKVWNMQTTSLRGTLKGHEHSVCDIAVMSRNRIVSGSGDKTVKVWNYWLALVSGRS